MTMKRYTPEELAEVIRLHGLWLNDSEGGVRANLRGANLDGANLYGANLRCANLYGANLDGANLRCANLYGANLYGANLYGANLDGANLDGANLRCANLDGAKNFQPFLSVGPMGSRRDYTYIHLNEDVVRCGCFKGTLAEFEAAVRQTHAENPVHLGSYLGVVAMAKAVREVQPPVEPQTPEAPPFQKGNQVQLTGEGREKWIGAPEGPGKVLTCSGGWTLVDYPTRYASFPDTHLALAMVKEEGVA